MYRHRTGHQSACMANRPRSFPSNAPTRGPSGSAPSGGGAPPKKDPRTALAELLVNDLTKPERRENALFELSKVGLCLSLEIQVC